MQVLKFLALICVIALGGLLKWKYYCKKPYNECTPDQQRIRRVGAVICGVCAVACFVKIIIAVLGSR